MDILSQAAPKSQPKTQTTLKVVAKAPETKQTEQSITTSPAKIPDKVHNLDTGHILNVANSKRYSDILTLLDIASLCSKCIEYDFEYAMLDDKYKPKFSSTLEQIYYKVNSNRYFQAQEYLSTKYSTVEIELEVIIDDDKVQVQDKIYVLDDTVYIQPELEEVIDYIIKGTLITKIYNLETQVLRSSKVCSDLKIKTNNMYCNRCMYYSICDNNNYA